MSEPDRQFVFKAALSALVHARTELEQYEKNLDPLRAAVEALDAAKDHEWTDWGVGQVRQRVAAVIAAARALVHPEIP